MYLVGTSPSPIGILPRLVGRTFGRVLVAAEDLSQQPARRDWRRTGPSGQCVRQL